MLTLAVMLTIWLAMYFPMRRLGKAQVKRAKLKRLEMNARDWQASGYLIPVRFYWEGENPALLWRRTSDGKEFPMVMD